MITESTVQEALRVIVDNKWKDSLSWEASFYAGTANNMTGKMLLNQCVRILGKMKKWHGSDAKAVRQTLKAFTERI